MKLSTILVASGHVSSTYVERLKGISLVVRSEVVTTPQPELPFSSLDTLMVDVDVVMFISVLKCGGNNFSTRNFPFHLFLLMVDFSLSDVCIRVEMLVCINV